MSKYLAGCMDWTHAAEEGPACYSKSGPARFVPMVICLTGRSLLGELMKSAYLRARHVRRKILVRGKTIMYSTAWHKASHQRFLARRVDVFAYYSVHFLALLGLNASDHSQWASSFRRDRVMSRYKCYPHR